MDNILKNLPDGLYITGTNQLIRTHRKGQCKGEYCTIHNPSNHHMHSWPTHWRDDRKIMERICKCGVGHPDPDDLAFRINKLGQDPKYAGIHGCCGCCDIKGNNSEEHY